MLHVQIPRMSFFRKSIMNRFARKPTVIGLFAYRYDQHLIPDLLENISPFIDGWIAWDDTQRSDLWYHEGNVRRKLIEAARSNGADWVLCVDPDERYESRLKQRISQMISGDRYIVWGFPFRELYQVDGYRTDGIWGQKVRWNLFALNEQQSFMDLNVHSPWHPQNPNYSLQVTDINLYHLKMIDPQNRIDRAELYKKVDVQGIQGIGYDYLADETGIEIVKIPTERLYSPFRPEVPIIKQNEHIT